MMSSAALTGYDDRWNQGTPAIAAAVTSGQPLYPAPPVDMDDVHQHARAQLPPAVNSSIPIDPSLAASWPTYYAPYPPNPSLQAAQQLQAAHSAVLPRPTSSTSSRPAESPQSQLDSGSLASNANGKRPAAPAVSSSRKKTRTLKSEGDDDAFDDEPSPTIDKDEKSKPTRGTRACTVCRRLKMKCIDANNPPCRRCLNGNHECVFEESNRGKRNPNQQLKKHEQLTQSLKKMERQLDHVLRTIGQPALQSTESAGSRSASPSSSIVPATQSLLASPPNVSFQPPPSPKLHSLPDNALNPLGLLAEASLANRKFLKASADSKKADATQPQKLGIANDKYFKPGPMTILPLRRLYIERQVQPEMLTFVSTEEVVALFNIYFKHINPHCNLLLRDFHTPPLVCSRSPFLLTTICAISAKFYTEKPELHGRLNALAKQLSFSVPERGYKSIEIVQAYLLLTLWGAGHTENYEQEKTWLLLGMAIRVATDLNLHRKSTSVITDTPEGKMREREIRNRERTWLLCFILDRSISAQMGKPHCIKEDNIVRAASQWWDSPSAAPPDSGVCAYVELQRIMSRSLDFLYSGTTSVSGLQIDCDYLVVTKTIETQLLAWHSDWVNHRSLHPASQDEHLPYRKLVGKFYFNYALLVVNSFGLQNAMDQSQVDIGHFFARCHTSATTVALIVRDELGPLGYLKYSPDSHFVQISYAVLTLLKLVRPEFRAYMDNEAKTLSLVNDIANLLGEIATSPQHTPALYSAFLKALMVAKGVGSQLASPRGSVMTPVHQYGESMDSERETVFSTSTDGESLQRSAHHVHDLAQGLDVSYFSDYNLTGEMGPASDISTFPPTMASTPGPFVDDASILSMDSIVTPNFWDNLLIPGYSNSFEGLSGGVIYGAGGSGLITPRVGSPIPLHAS